MQTVKWSSECSVALPVIDEQHERINRISESLIQSIQDGPAQHPNRKTLLTQLAEYTEKHFMAEETMMRLIEFPGFAAHKQAHDSILETLRELFLEPEIASFGKNTEFLSCWLSEHIAQFDKGYAEYYKSITLHP